MAYDLTGKTNTPITNIEGQDGESLGQGQITGDVSTGTRASYGAGSDGLIWEGITKKAVIELSPGSWAGFE